MKNQNKNIKFFTLREQERIIRGLANGNLLELNLDSMDNCFFIGHPELGKPS